MRADEGTPTRCESKRTLRRFPASEASTAAGLETLFRSYQKPLYSFLRCQGNSHHDAEDLLQAFFTRLMAKDVLRTASPEEVLRTNAENYPY